MKQLAPIVFVLTLALLAPHGARAQQPNIFGQFVFTEHRGPSALFGESYDLLVGANIVESFGTGLSVTATNGPHELVLSPGSGSLFPDQYVARVPYQDDFVGEWIIEATDSTGGSTVALSLVDPKNLPLVTGLAATGSVLTPHVTWDGFDPPAFPGFCLRPCVVGTDFFRYQVEVRRIEGGSAGLAFLSPQIPSGNPAMFDVPEGVIEAGGEYLIGLRFNHFNVHTVLENGTAISDRQNRSTAFISYAVPVPEPGTYALLLAGLGLLGFAARRRSGRWKKRTRRSGFK